MIEVQSDDVLPAKCMGIACAFDSDNDMHAWLKILEQHQCR